MAVSLPIEMTYGRVIDLVGFHIGQRQINGRFVPDSVEICVHSSGSYVLLFGKRTSFERRVLSKDAAVTLLEPTITNMISELEQRCQGN